MLLGLASCEAGDEPETEQGEVCGEPGPFVVLALDDDELPYPSGVTRIGERLYIRVGDAVVDGSPISFLPVGGSPRIWSTGLCGESPRLIATDFGGVFEHPQWPGSVVARDEDANELYALDPDGVAVPHLLMPALSDSPATDTDLGEAVVIADEGDDAGMLVLQPFPESITDDPPAPIDLLDDVSTASGAITGRGAEVYALTATGDLVRVELPGGAATTIAQGVDQFALSEDLRFVVLMRAMAVSDPEAMFATAILDRETGEETWVGDAARGLNPLLSLQTALVFEIPRPGGEVSRIVDLPSLGIHDGPPEVRLSHRIDASKFLGAIEDGVVMYDIVSRKLEVLLEATPSTTIISDDAIVMLESPLDSGQLFGGEGPLWRVAFDTGEPERLAARATPGFELLEGGGVVTVVEADADLLGDLVLVDPQTGHEQRIDERVFFGARALGDGVIAYGVRDGERSGIWLAHPGAD
jgi:hypothetical protein